MLLKSPACRAALCLGVALGGAAGCLVVAPLEPLQDGAGGKSAGGKNSGGTNSGAAMVGASAGAGEAGEAPTAGQGNGSDGCHNNAECVRKGSAEPYRCRPSDHKCVALKTPACPLAYGNAEDPNAIYFGTFATLNDVVPEDSSVVWSHLLALDELSGENVGGLPYGPNTRRPLVMIVCNNADDIVAPGLKHLAEDVQVPAIIAMLQPADLREGFETYRARDIFYLSPVSVTRPVVEEKDDDMIWNLLGQPSDMAPTYAELLKLAEKRLRKERKMQSTDQLKVALVTTKAAFDSELSKTVGPLLSFNGLSAEANGTSYYPVTLNPTDSLQTIADEIADFGPDVIISAAGEPFSKDSGLLERIEGTWGGFQKLKPRPFYMLSPYNAGDLSRVTQLMNGFIQFGAEVDPQQRFVGVTIAGPRDNTLQNTYALNLRTMFKDAYPDSANYYDATYFLAYAMYGAGTETELSGSGIARGMRRLLDGDDYAIGPDAISSTFDALTNADSSVHLVSTLGPPDFDAKTGVRPVEGGVLCFEKVGFTVELHSDVLRYDAAEGALTGTFPCFSGFYP